MWLVLAACEVVPSEQFTPRMVIHGQLRVGDTDSLRVIVNRTYTIDEPHNWEFPDAHISIWRGDDTTRPMERQSGDVYDAFYPRLAVRPGDTFSILVTKDGFDTVSGRTVVPDTFHFLYPQQGDTVTPYDSLGWARSRTAAGYYFTYIQIEDGDTSSWTIAIGNDSLSGVRPYDSTRVNIPSMLFYYGSDPGWKKLTVYAVDSNYYDWVRMGGFGFGGATPAETTRLTGGLGVLGSAAVETLGFYLKMGTARVRRASQMARCKGQRSECSEDGSQLEADLLRTEARIRNIVAGTTLYHGCITVSAERTRCPTGAAEAKSEGRNQGAEERMPRPRPPALNQKTGLR